MRQTGLHQSDSTVSEAVSGSGLAQMHQEAAGPGFITKSSTSIHQLMLQNQADTSRLISLLAAQLTDLTNSFPPISLENEFDKPLVLTYYTFKYKIAGNIALFM